MATTADIIITNGIVITVDGTPVYEGAFAYPDQASGKIRFQLPRPTDQPLQIHIALPDAVSPASVGAGGDSRILGFGLHAIRLIPGTAATASGGG